MQTLRSLRNRAGWLLAAAFLLPVPTFAAGSEITRDNVVIVLDASGSMADKMPGGRQVKMDAAKSALKQVLQQLSPDIQVGLLVFSGANVPNEWVYPLGPRDDARLVQAIDQPRPQGSTPLGAFLKKGADRLLQERDRQLGYGTFRLLVVTDGEAQDQELVRRHTPEIVARGITVDVIGVAMSQRHTLATHVHSYRAANDPGSLRRAIADVFAEVGSRTTDAASDEAFAALGSIPEGVALAAIQALSTSGNQPIGERPSASTAAQRPSTAQAPATAQPPPAPPQPQPQPAPASPPPTPGPGGPPKVLVLIGGLLGGLLCFGIPVLFVLAWVVRATRRSRR